MPRSSTDLLTVLLLFVATGAASLPAAKPDPALLAAASRFEPLLAAPQTSTAALSPDGTKVAFDVRRDGELSVVTLDLTGSTHPIGQVVVGRDAPPSRLGSPRTEILALEWISTERLVVATRHPVLRGQPDVTLFTFDYDGAQPASPRRLTGSDQYLQVLGVLPGAAPRLVLATRWRGLTQYIPGTGTTHGSGPKQLLLVDLVDGRIRHVDIDSSLFLQVMNELDALERTRDLPSEADLAFITQRHPHAQARLLPGHPGSTRRIARLQRPDHPDRFVAFDRRTGELRELVDRPDSVIGYPARFQAFTFTVNNETFRGFIALPPRGDGTETPVVHLLWDTGEHLRFHDYEPLVAAFQAMGFAVTVVAPLDDIESAHASRAAPVSDSTIDFLEGPPSIEGPAERAAERDRIRRATNPTADEAWPENQHQLRALDHLADRYNLSLTAIALYADHRTEKRALLLNAQAPGRFQALLINGLEAGPDLEQGSAWSMVLPPDPAFARTRALIAYPDAVSPTVSYFKRIVRRLRSVGIECTRLPLERADLDPDVPPRFAVTLARFEVFLRETLTPNPAR